MTNPFDMKNFPGFTSMKDRHLGILKDKSFKDKSSDHCDGYSMPKARAPQTLKLAAGGVAKIRHKQSTPSGMPHHRSPRKS